MAFCFAKNRLFRVTLSLHSFATLRNWLRQPLQSLPQFKIEKFDIKNKSNFLVPYLSKKILFISIFILIFGAFFLVPVIPVLSITNRKAPNQKVYSIGGFKNGFIISYTHSVNKGRVKDYYTIKSDYTLLCDKSVFLSYGAGIPEPQDFPDAVFSVTSEGYTITNINRNLKKLTMAVGIIANHSITILNSNVVNSQTEFSDSKEFFLTDFFEPQTSINLQIKRVSLIKYLTSKKI